MSSKSTYLNLEIESDSYLETDKSCLSFDFSISLLPIKSNPQVESLINSKKNPSTGTEANPFGKPGNDIQVPEIPDTIAGDSDEEEGEFGVVIKKPEDDQADEIEDISQPPKPEQAEPHEDASAVPIDLLEISFKKNGELPQHVEKHIESKIGLFQKNENEEDNMTTLTFEVNFHQIDKSQIWQSYQRFFEQSADDEQQNMHLQLSFRKNGDLDDMFESFKRDPEIPLILHLLENSQLKLDGKNPDYLLKTGMNYLKSHMNTEMAFLEILLMKFKGVKGKMKLGPLSDISKGFWQRMDLDQTQNFGGFFDVWRTPLLNYIFTEGEGVLHVKGTVFNYFAYEFRMQVTDFAKFLSKIKQEFK